MFRSEQAGVAHTYMPDSAFCRRCRPAVESSAYMRMVIGYSQRAVASTRPRTFVNEAQYLAIGRVDRPSIAIAFGTQFLDHTTTGVP